MIDDLYEGQLLKVRNYDIDNQLAGRLESTPLFGGVDHNVVQRFYDQSMVRSCSKGKVIFMHEESADFFYMVMSGWVKLFREALDGSEVIIDILSSDHFFGDMAAFEPGCYDYGAQAIDDTDVLMIPLSLLRNELASNLDFSKRMLNIMALRQRKQLKDLEHRDIQNTPRRIGCFLLKLCANHHQDTITLHLPYDKTLLASRLGMKSETFSRALAWLKKEQGIQINGSAVTIQSIDRLSNYVCLACSSSYPCVD